MVRASQGQGMGIVHIQRSIMALDFSANTLWNNFFKIVMETILLLRILSPDKSSVMVE